MSSKKEKLKRYILLKVLKKVNVPKNASNSNKFTQKRMKDHQTIDKLQPRPPF